MIRGKYDLASARAVRAAQAKTWSRQVAEFSVFRPTPTQEENDTTALTETPVPVKLWDLSPIDESSFDPFEPPGRPGPPPLPVPPVNTVLPAIIALDGHQVGDVLASQQGSWSGSPPITYARQWFRGVEPIVGATLPGYTLTTDDLDAFITLDVTASNAGGSATATSAEVGPIEAAAGSNPPKSGNFPTLSAT
jgi:hypothetical protein